MDHAVWNFTDFILFGLQLWNICWKELLVAFHTAASIIAIKWEHTQPKAKYWTMDKLLWRNLCMQLISKSASRSWTQTKIFLYWLISLHNKNESGWKANSSFLGFKHLSRHCWCCKPGGWAAMPWWRHTGNNMEINSMDFSVNENSPVFYNSIFFLLWKSPGHFCTDSVLVWPQHFPDAATWEHSKQRSGDGSD